MCGVCGNNFKDVDVDVLLGIFICVIGVFGGGKFIFLIDILFKVVVCWLNGVCDNLVLYDWIEGLEVLDKVIDID